MENPLRFEISVNLTEVKFYKSEFHYTRSHVNTDNEVTSHRSEILHQSEIL